MRKKLSILLLSVLLVVSSFGMMLVVKADPINDGEWTSISATNNYQSENGYTEIADLVSWGARSSYNYKVKLDGLEINLKTTANSGDFVGICLGSSIYSYFTESNTPVALTLWKNLFSGQTRLHVGASHDYNGVPLVYTATDGATAGFGVATSMVINDAATLGFKVKFTLENESYYRLTFTMTDSTMWEVNANYDANGGGEGIPTCHVFMPVSAIQSALDENGELYVAIAGMPSGTNPAVSAFVKVSDANSIDYEANALLNASNAKTAYSTAINNIIDETTFNTAMENRTTLQTAIESLRENDKSLYITELSELDGLIKANTDAQTTIKSIVQSDIDLFALANTVIGTESNINDVNILSATDAKNTALASFNSKMNMLTAENITSLQASYDSEVYKLQYAKALKWILNYETIINDLDVSSETIGANIASVKAVKSAYANSTEEEIKNSLIQLDKDALNTRIANADIALNQAESDADVAVKTAYLLAFETAMNEDLTLFANINFALTKYTEVTENISITVDDGELNTRLLAGYQNLKLAFENYYNNEIDAVSVLLDSTYTTYTAFEPIRTRYKAINYGVYINDTFDDYQNIVDKYAALTTKIQNNIWYYIGQTSLTNLNRTESGIYFDMIGSHPNRINYNKLLDLDIGIDINIELTNMAYYNGDKTDTGNSKGANNICINFLSQANSYKSLSSGISIIIWLFESESSVQIVNNKDVAIATAVLSTPINGGSFEIKAKYQDYYDFVSDSTYKAYVFDIGGNQIVVKPEQFVSGGIVIPESNEVYFSLGTYSDYRQDPNSFTIKSINNVNFGLTKLDAPEIVLNENVVSWAEVENATSYIVTVNGIANEVNALSYTIADTTVGDYTISVQAVGNEEYVNSNTSNTVTYTIQVVERKGCNSSANTTGILAILSIAILFTLKKIKN